MVVEKVIGVASAIVTVALVATIVRNPTSSAIINSIGNAFANALRAAQGR